YFPLYQLQHIVKQPLTVLEVIDKYDIRANLDGGGTRGQAEALRLAIARALVEIDPECKKVLRANGFLTRDPRVVERKKPGRPGARRRFQFSKR
ncbi:MAG: 30S ribosomal protein S9, partial [Bacteroidales bacterium]